MDVRVATPGELPRLVETISLAFHNDPTWAWAFPDPARRQEQYAVWWGLLIGSALRYPWVLRTAGFEAVAVWIPPGGTELTEAEEARIEPMLETLVDSHVGDAVELLDRFDANHPHGEPHYYLSLLGTHPDHRGRGVGMRLLEENLTRIDAEHMPAHLESSNPANNHRYERLGFEATGVFHPPGRPDLPVTTMWRPAG
jgi:GNAT superfamily N-acetyltransferase